MRQIGTHTWLHGDLREPSFFELHPLVITGAVAFLAYGIGFLLGRRAT